MNNHAFPPWLAYGFAQTNGVIVLQDDNSTICQNCSDGPLDAPIEAQRVFGGPLPFAEVSVSEFEVALGTVYCYSASQAAPVGADADDDLASLADSAA